MNNFLHKEQECTMTNSFVRETKMYPLYTLDTLWNYYFMDIFSREHKLVLNSQLFKLL